MRRPIAKRERQAIDNARQSGTFSCADGYCRDALIRLNPGVLTAARARARARNSFFDSAGIYSPRSRVRAAFFAEADLAAAVRLRAAVRVCWDNASGETAALLSRLRAFNVACDRLAEGFFPELAFSRSRWALRRVASEVLPGFGGASFTPARRALESPMAMACFAERAPCFPARISSISSRTNSPAWVEADFPSRASRRARSIVWFLGIMTKKIRGRASRRLFIGVGVATVERWSAGAME